MKKILIKNHNCCHWASVGYSTYMQSKSDKAFKDVDIKHEISDIEDLEIYIDDELYWNWNKKGMFIHACVLVKRLKKKLVDNVR